MTTLPYMDRVVFAEWVAEFGLDELPPGYTRQQVVTRLMQIGILPRTGIKHTPPQVLSEDAKAVAKWWLEQTVGP